MSLLYIVVAICVMVLLALIPLFPFWKVWSRIKSHHADLWNEKGPFTLRQITAYPVVFSNFMSIIHLADSDENLRARDPELIRWTRMAREVWKMMPKGFGGQIVAFLLFLYFVGFFTSIITGVFQPS